LKIGGTGLAGAALLGTAGCGGGGGGDSGNLILSHGPEESGVLRKQLDAFNQQHKGEIQVEWRQMPADTGQYFDQLRTEFQAGGGEIDVISGDVIWPAQFAAQGWIMDLSDRFPESQQQKFLPATIESNLYEGAIYGVPWFSDVGMLYYRRDLLEQSGIGEPPATWEELKQMAEQVRQDSGTKYGFVFQGANYEGGVVDGLEYIWTHGGDVLDGNNVVIDSPESAAGLATERSMVTDGVTPQAVVNYTETESHTTFLNGDAVFIRNWPYMYGLASDPEQSKIKPEQIGVAPLPAGEGGQSFSGLGGWNLFINAASQDKVDAAWTLIQYLSAPEQVKARSLQGGPGIPTYRSLYDDQEITSQVPVVALAKESAQNAKPRPVSPYYSDMSLEMAEQFNASLKGDISPEEAVKTLQSQLQQIVEQAQ
ncbi:MAG: ABC transporter substrate-binding protein, partial [Actinobacteria bacterium]|nr:ABC transporter substrate-binding protein [Actinomycetota bacterium]